MAHPQGGVLVAGFLRSESGFGQVPRSLLPVFREIGEQVKIVERFEDDAARRQAHELAFEPDDVGVPARPPDVALVFENADSMPSSFDSGALDAVGDAAVVGYWCWELDRFPTSLAGAAEYVDEVWTLSEHTAAAIAPEVDVPVVAVPPVVTVRRTPAPARASLGLPEDSFVVLFTYDARGGTARKAPEAAIDAYLRAFGPDEGCTLVLKSINAATQPGLLGRLRDRARGRTDVEIRDGYLSAAEQSDLVASCDVYLSLHRAEGFGLGMAEAMAAARPVVATGWSGNLDFMAADTARLVAYTLAPVPDAVYPWPVAGGRWAIPDVDGAARALQDLRADPAGAAALGARARASIAEHHSVAARAITVRDRLTEVRRHGRRRLTRRTAVVPAPEPAVVAVPRRGLVRRAFGRLRRVLER